MKRVPRPNVRKRRSRAKRRRRNQKRRLSFALSSAIRSSTPHFGQTMGDIFRDTYQLKRHIDDVSRPIEVSTRAMRIPFAINKKETTE